MKSAKKLVGPNNNDQSDTNNQASSSDGQQSQDSTMSLVYPDGRVTNVSVRQKKNK